MSSTPADQLERELDRCIDVWQSGDSIAATGSGELGDLLEVVALVSAGGAAAFAGGTVRESSPSGGAPAPDLVLGTGIAGRRRAHERQAPLARIAAVVLLVAAAATGLGLALAHRAPAKPVPIGAPKQTPPPAPLLEQLASDAGFLGDPYPSQPVAWVKTTYAHVLQVVHGHFEFYPELAASAPFYAAEMHGRFYGAPSTRSGIFSTYWVFYSPARQGGTGSVAGPLPSSEAGLSDLSSLGTVHYYRLVAPATPPYAPLPAAMAHKLETDAQANGEPAPPHPVLWIRTTAGALRAKVGGLGWSVLAQAPASEAAWVAYYGAGFSSGPAKGAEPLWLVGLGPSASVQYSWLGSAGAMDAFAGEVGLGRLGSVHESWITPLLPATVPSRLWPLVVNDLQGRYTSPGQVVKPLPPTVSGKWVDLPLARLEADVTPQWDTSWAGVPGNTTVWVIELDGLRQARGLPGHSDWLLEWGGTASTPVTWQAQGGSPLLGITSLAQLGPVHSVTFHLHDSAVVSVTG